ncbi:hypothetical protein PHYBLDRAFT_62687 [Phycomyces blakesleeanus NRRL 1555(-)]|uniref:Uncharacterized protein n=1 Tax=Phycomyces blakesleeanus (strain ATCC 8743b / DSM 1359 / FGSC 10004 / NBRC 33097 / NRRL 1555) TaxID=763407 RepID=A0A167PUA4_PHYB8|nr:hypothetical protein PHYBLDRAFT_62687 [Phycomyces blakesleeanus NRRL 1555(-)]OAD78549.1 hypothetical protein PHYBLDRAFT_62687 [Phycomyces blakesleeanus NRRL 1555(-)]|eukprot:XP_018296589.1 hypothetical protein PHYBLDRAFT_62687 [Phycomyces blakesleeanus NRRL 1555(-)]
MKLRIWYESISSFSIYYNTPPEFSPEFSTFFDTLLQSFSSGEIALVAIAMLFFPSPAIASLFKKFKLDLLKLLQFGSQDYKTIVPKLRVALTKYDHVQDMFINTFFSFMSGTWSVYVEHLSYEKSVLLPLRFKIDFDDNTTFLSTWFNIRAYCTHCQSVAITLINALVVLEKHVYATDSIRSVTFTHYNIALERSTTLVNGIAMFLSPIILFALSPARILGTWRTTLKKVV